MKHIVLALKLAATASLLAITACQQTPSDTASSELQSQDYQAMFEGRFTTDPFSMYIPEPAKLTPEGQAWVDNFTPDMDPALQCPESGTPHVLFTPDPIEIEFLADGNIRSSAETFYMDGRVFPENLDLTKPGYSIGRWEGQTLVVETRGLLSGDILSPYNATMKPSDELTMKRKIYLVDQDKRWAALGLANEEVNPLQLEVGRTLQVDVWLTDPLTFQETWHTIKQYRELSSDILDEDLTLNWNAGDAGLPDDFVDNYSGDCVLFPEYEEE